ncbi:MAG: hypothetical protein AAF654_10755 [Myxococcota bacterium]
MSGSQTSDLVALSYFARPDSINFDIAAGVLRTARGTRLCGVNHDFLRGFVGACVHEAGPAAFGIVASCGRHFGRRLASRVEDELGAELGRSIRTLVMHEFDGVLRQLWRTFGMGEVEFDWATGQSSGSIPVTLRHSPALGIQIEEDRRDALMTGLLEGFVNHFTDTPLTCVQTLVSKGPAETEECFVLVPGEAAENVRGWVTAGAPHEIVVERLARSR